MHFHECEIFVHEKREKNRKCVKGRGNVYTPVELAVEAARMKALQDFTRFRKIV
jgi:hypothetical protein